MTEPQLAPVPQRLVNIGDREVLCRGLNETQHMALVHEQMLMKKDDTTTDRKFKGVDRLYRVILSMVMDDDDREYVEDQVAEGKLNVLDFARILREVHGESGQAPVVQRARRGRPAKRQ